MGKATSNDSGEKRRNGRSERTNALWFVRFVLVLIERVRNPDLAIVTVLNGCSPFTCTVR